MAYAYAYAYTYAYVCTYVGQYVCFSQPNSLVLRYLKTQACIESCNAACGALGLCNAGLWHQAGSQQHNTHCMQFQLLYQLHLDA